MPPPDLEQLVRQAFERWSRGDHSLDPRWTHPDVVIVSVDGLVSGGTYRGHEGVEQWARDITDAFDEWTLQLDELEEFAPGRALAVGAVHFRGRGSGVTVDIPCAWLIEHEDRLLTRFEVFANRVDEARAIAASG